jgi:hypothetical protein
MRLPFFRESTFIMPRGEDEDVKAGGGGGPGGGGGGGGGGGTEIYSGIKGAGSESSEGGYKRFKVLVQQGPGVFTPTIVN